MQGYYKALHSFKIKKTNKQKNFITTELDPPPQVIVQKTYRRTNPLPHTLIYFKQLSLT